MKTRSKTLVAAIAISVLALAPFAFRSPSQTVKTELPKGNWSLSAGPYSNPEHKTMPVDVIKVKTNAMQGLTIESVGLFNRSEKEVKAVRLHWDLSEKSQGKVLLKGDTEFLEFKLPSGAEFQLNYPLVSFDKIYRPLMRDGVLRGDFRLEVLVSEVRFADNSTWNRAQPPLQHKVAFRHHAFEGCQSQGCVWNGEVGSYQCASHDKTECSVASGGQSCTESRCPGDIE